MDGCYIIVVALKFAAAAPSRESLYFTGDCFPFEGIYIRMLGMLESILCQPYKFLLVCLDFETLKGSVNSLGLEWTTFKREKG